MSGCTRAYLGEESRGNHGGAGQGVALAVSQLIDPSAAQALLHLFVYSFGISPPSNDHLNRLLQLLVQFLITILLTGVIYSLYQRWRLK